MPLDLKRAARLIELFLMTFDDETGLDEAVETIVAAKDAESLQFVSALMNAYPLPNQLESFWALVDDDDAETDSRVEALRAIAGVLLNAEEDLDAVEFGLQTMLDEPFLSQVEFDRQLKRLMRTYRTAEYPVDVRRYALEMAANVSQEEEIVSAGRASFTSDDPKWIGSGLVVISLTDRGGSRDAIYASLDHDDVLIRLEAIRCLGLLERSRDIDTLGKVVLRRTGRERIAALNTLAEMPDPDAGQTLFDCTDMLAGSARAEAEEAYEAWLDDWGGIDESVFRTLDDVLDDDFDDESLDDEI